MDIKALFPVLWILMTYLPQNEATMGGNWFFNYPLILIYDKAKNLFASVDQTILTEHGVNCTEYILACPIQDRETAVTSYDAMNVNAVYPIPVASRDLRICGHRFKMSMVENNVGSGYNVGYYLLNTWGVLPRNDLPDISTVLGTAQVIVSKRTPARQKIYELEIDATTRTTIYTRHRINSYQLFRDITASEPCKTFKDNIITTNMNDSEDIYNFYNKKNLKKLLENYNTKITEFIPTQLTPIDDFTDNASKVATCTYYNTVPMLPTIAEGLIKKMESAIRYVADILEGNSMEVTTKPFGIMKLRLKEGSKIHHQEVYLDYENQRIPVPKIFMKIIHYQVPFAKADEEDSGKSPNYKHYYMVVGVYHTLRSMSSEIDYVPNCKCSYEVCERYGWKIAIDRTTEKAQFFCCDIKDSQSMEALGLGYIQGEIFDLNDGEVKKSTIIILPE